MTKNYPMDYNTRAELRIFFDVTQAEFDEFWNSLTLDEKYHYIYSDLHSELWY